MAGVVHIVDDDEAIRDSLCFLLASSGLPVKAHDSATAFLAALGTLDDGCVVTDVRMPDVSGIDVLRAVREHRPSMPVVVVTGHGDVMLAVEAMKLGAVDFIEKPYPDEAMVAAVEMALGRHELDRANLDERATFMKRVQTLSERERQVLHGILDGKANKIIADNLGISPRTIEVYRANLMVKMRASGLSHLVRMALLAGLKGN